LRNEEIVYDTKRQRQAISPRTSANKPLHSQDLKKNNKTKQNTLTRSCYLIEINRSFDYLTDVEYSLEDLIKMSELTNISFEVAYLVLVNKAC